MYFVWIHDWVDFVPYISNVMSSWSQSMSKLKIVKDQWFALIFLPLLKSSL